jgi:F-type H+-transporting ATPase subunit alpha
MNAAPENLQSVFERTFAGISQGLGGFAPQFLPREIGTVVSVTTGIAKVAGLPGVGFEELVTFPGGVLGIAFNVDEDEIGVVLLGAYQDLHAGDEVERTGRVMDVAVGDELLGRVIDPLGRPLDGNGAGGFQPAAAHRTSGCGHHGSRTGHGATSDGLDGH